ncbi:MAG: phenylalanine--tRNA ligase subunit alpha [Gemmatimonadota bacterium]|nr:phenylalanine--tRNA ligase subunit alpha [Gemmatimonadota bacterium]
MTGGGVPLLERLSDIEERGLEAFRRASDVEELEAARIEFLGRSGELSEALGRIGDLDPEHRPTAGRRGNEVKARLESAHEERAEALRREGRRAAAEERDLTLPGRRRWRGTRHPFTQVVDEICDIFREIGFTRVGGPEVETEWYNFTALNIPLDHPAADEHDTFYLEDGVVLRTHTSPVQARVMEKHRPPIRIVVPGLCYRRDTWDPTHAPAFDQIEGLAVDEGVDFVEFRSAIDHFAHRFFGPSTRTRFRPGYFPFTEPSAEVDVTCPICDGDGCSTCSRTGWIEIMGAGMVDPAVFEAVGYDPERYTGYAFGMGPGRIAMIRHGVPDLRLFYAGDVRFLEQFGT